MWSDQIKYLGIIIDRRLTFNLHIGHIINKVDTTIRILYPFINRQSKVNRENKLILFKVIFQAIFYYGAPVWGNCANTHLKRLQTKQNKILKMMLNLPHRYPTSALHDVANICPVTNKIKDITEKFFEKCTLSENYIIRSLRSPF